MEKTLWELTCSYGEDESKMKQWNRRKRRVKLALFEMPKSLTTAFSKLFNMGSWNVRGVLPKLNDIEVVLARKENHISGIQESITLSWRK